MRPPGKLAPESGTSVWELLERSRSVSEHSTHIQASRRLVQSPKSFHQIGIQFKELTEQSLWDLCRRQVHPIQGSEQSQQVESGSFQTRPEITRHSW
jgi:hypothetical protein